MQNIFVSIFTHKSWLTDRFHEWKIVEQHIIVYYSWAKFKCRTVSIMTEKFDKPNQVVSIAIRITDIVVWRPDTLPLILYNEVNIWVLSVTIHPNWKKSTMVRGKISQQNSLYRDFPSKIGRNSFKNCKYMVKDCNFQISSVQTL